MSNDVGRLFEALQARKIPVTALEKSFKSVGGDQGLPLWEATGTLPLAASTLQATAVAAGKKAAWAKVCSQILQDLTGTAPSTAAAAPAPVAAGPDADADASPQNVAKLYQLIQSWGFEAKSVLREELGQGGDIGKGASLWTVTLFLRSPTMQLLTAAGAHARRKAAKAIAAGRLLTQLGADTSSPPKHSPAQAGSAAAGGGSTPQGGGQAAPAAADLPQYEHHRTVTCTVKAEEVEAWLAPVVVALEGWEEGQPPAATLGFDTEWHGSQGVGSPTVLLQLASHQRALVVHLEHIHHVLASSTGSFGAATTTITPLPGQPVSVLGAALPSLLLTLTHPGVLKVGRALTNDAPGLRAAFSGDMPSSFTCGPTFGYTDVTAGTILSANCSAPTLAATVMHQRFAKRVSSYATPWKWPLTAAELEYAVDDAALPLDASLVIAAMRQGGKRQGLLL